MPELPEVETTVRDLRKKVLKRTFVDVWTDTEKIIKCPSSFRKFKKEIIGKKIEDIKRKGKNILFFLSQKKVLLVHQKLTGHLLYGKWRKKNNKWTPTRGSLSEKVNTFLHLIFFLDNGKQIALSDLRKFAKVALYPLEKFHQLKEIKELGPDPLTLTFEKFKERISSSKKSIKEVLMDQKIISGVGNIYSAEALFLAKIHPLKKASDLSEKEKKRLFKAIRKVLKEAIKLGGESISDYRKIDGTKGLYDRIRRVYRRDKCPICSSQIKKIKINQRSAYFCPKCQKL